jgi:spermidine synthase
MLPWVQLAVAAIPGGGELRLKRRGTEFSIMLGANELMNSRLSGSEQALATLGCEAARIRKGASVLIGGLGMGFTLRAALAVLPADARITVAELVPEVAAWARAEMAPVFGRCLADPRVTISIGDVSTLISTARSSFDAILLDVDNGPDGLTTDANDRLYGASGLRQSLAALKPGGALAVWSAHPAATFGARLNKAGFTVSEHRVRARGKGRGGKGGAKHVIWVAVKAGEGSSLG